jgi:hypothetical protein
VELEVRGRHAERAPDLLARNHAANEAIGPTAKPRAAPISRKRGIFPERPRPKAKVAPTTKSRIPNGRIKWRSTKVSGSVAASSRVNGNTSY